MNLYAAFRKSNPPTQDYAHTWPFERQDRDFIGVEYSDQDTLTPEQTAELATANFGPVGAEAFTEWQNRPAESLLDKLARQDRDGIDRLLDRKFNNAGELAAWIDTEARKLPNK
jgi:hypothetical protein